MANMKAVRIHDYGGPEALRYEDVPRPSPKDDELLVRVHAIGVNPVDWKVRSGFARKMLQVTMPVTLGGEISGVVEQAGPGASGFKAGDAVFGMLGLLGAYAQYVAVRPALLAPKPSSLDHITAASVPLAALTAWQGLDAAGLAAGQRVLVHAAAGGVGGFAVQLARARGAHVIGTASAKNGEYVRGLGAQQVIDYNSEAFERAVTDVDVVIDLVGGTTAERSVGVLKQGGALVQITPGTPAVTQLAAERKVRLLPMRVSPNGAQLREIAALIDSGRLRSSVAAVFPLAEAGKAHEQSATGHTRGKLVLNALEG